MSQKIFWPLTVTVMGFILLSSNLGLISKTFWSLWPIIMIVVGLGGLITIDSDEWLHKPKKGKKK